MIQRQLALVALAGVLLATGCSQDVLMDVRRVSWDESGVLTLHLEQCSARKRVNVYSHDDSGSWLVEVWGQPIESCEETQQLELRELRDKTLVDAYDGKTLIHGDA